MIQIGDYIEDLSNGGAPPLFGWVTGIAGGRVYYHIDKVNSSKPWRFNSNIYESGRLEKIVTVRSVALAAAEHDAAYWDAITGEAP